MGKFFYAICLDGQEEELGNIGLEGKPVHLICYRDVAAVVSDYPEVDSIKLLYKNLSPYHRTCREAAKNFTTIPARFGQIARDEDEVQRLLRAHYSMLRKELERLYQKIEMGLRLWWEVDNLGEYFLQGDPELKSLRDQLLRKPGGLTRMEQLNFGSYFHDRMNLAREQIAKEVLATLPAGEAKLEEITEEKMVMNAALLVAGERQAEVEKAVGKIPDWLGEGYRIKLDGPWVPFSFVQALELSL